MVAMKPLSDSSEKWTRRASGAVGDLIKGVQNPKKSWKAESKLAAANYKASVTAAANEGRYDRGIDRSSDDNWQSMTEAKALSRYGEGVNLGQGSWERGYSPYQEAISRVQLPARGTRGSQQNYQRSAAVGQAANAVRTRLLTGK